MGTRMWIQESWLSQVAVQKSRVLDFLTLQTCIHTSVLLPLQLLQMWMLNSFVQFKVSSDDWGLRLWINNSPINCIESTNETQVLVGLVAAWRTHTASNCLEICQEVASELRCLRCSKCREHVFLASIQFKNCYCRGSRAPCMRDPILPVD